MSEFTSFSQPSELGFSGHPTDEKTDAQRDQVAQPGTHGLSVDRLRWELRSLKNAFLNSPLLYLI